MRNKLTILDLAKGIIIMSTILAAILYVKSATGKKDIKDTTQQAIAAFSR